MPQDRIIDGFDLVPMLLEGKASPRTTFFYYIRNHLEAVREGRWKLHVHKGDAPLSALYDLERDCAEQRNLLSAQPEVVVRLQGLLDACRNDLGDELTGVRGAHVRPAGRVEHPDTLTHYDPSHPYYLAMYDKGDAG